MTAAEMEMSETQEEQIMTEHTQRPNTIDPLEPPLPVSSSSALVHRKLDPLPAPVSGAVGEL